MGYVNIEPLTYIRGRSLPSVFMIVDEAQKPYAARSKDHHHSCGGGDQGHLYWATRTRSTTPISDSSNNGLTTLVEKFRAESIAGHVTLAKGERSELAELATQIL